MFLPNAQNEGGEGEGRVRGQRLIDFASVADVDDEERVGSSLVEILKLKFGRDFEPCFWSRYWSWSLVKILKFIFGQDFEAGIWSKFWGWSLFEILWQKIGQHFEP